MLKIYNATIILLISSYASISVAATKDFELASKIYTHLTGTPLHPLDPRAAQMESLAKAGQLKELAQIATADNSFYNVTIPNWVSKFSTRDESSFAPFNDLQALVVGIVRDDLDARLMLTGDFRYQAKTAVGVPPYSPNNNLHYYELGRSQSSLKDTLEKITPQGNYNGEASGALTTRSWAESFYQGGTNRRAVDYAFRAFMCQPITQWRDPGLWEGMIRRDVDRAPGGDFRTYNNVCRSCHAPMDALAGAFAKIDFADGVTIYSSIGVAKKYNQNIGIYPEGYKTLDDSWINQAKYHHNQSLGWRGPTDGRGIRAFGQMIADSQQFKKCMVQRTIREVCHKDSNSFDDSILTKLADGFETNGYKFKSLFEDVAIEPRCLETNGKPRLNIMNHRQSYATLAKGSVTETTDSTIRTLYENVRTLLPEFGIAAEVSSPGLFASSSNASYFCRRMISRDAAIADPTKRTAHKLVDFTLSPAGLTDQIISSVGSEYGNLFLRRDLTADEFSIFVNLINESRPESPNTPAATKDILTLGCTTIAGSIESITF